MNTSTPVGINCTLCFQPAPWFAEDRFRAYFRCCECELVIADPASHLDGTSEKAVYDQHENDPSDEAYRRFLNQLAAPLLSRLTCGMQGLDYGSGPGPTLSVMLEEAGMDVAIYDPYYAQDTAVLNRQYDFVTCTEVAEHFYRPARDWARLAGLVRQGGWLAVMTQLLTLPGEFHQWHYKNDPTHVSFYSRATIDWLALQYGLTIEYQQASVVLLLKQ